MNRIILLVGESGSGKTTIAELLEECFGLRSIQSYTTRPPRYKTETGHIFVTEGELQKIKTNDIVAYTEFSGYKYCATKQQVDESDIYVIDKDGIENFQKSYKGEKKPLIVYIKSTEDVRRKRMCLRGDSKEKINKRIEHDKVVFANVENIAEFVIENNEDTNLEALVKDIWRIFIS